MRSQLDFIFACIQIRYSSNPLTFEFENETFRIQCNREARTVCGCVHRHLHRAAKSYCVRDGNICLVAYVLGPNEFTIWRVMRLCLLEHNLAENRLQTAHWNFVVDEEESPNFHLVVSSIKNFIAFAASGLEGIYFSMYVVQHLSVHGPNKFFVDS